MAIENVGSTLPGGEAAADLSANQYYFVKVDSSGQVALCDTLGEKMDGVLQNDPEAQGRAATVWGVGSVSKVVASAAIAQGANVTTAASGKAVTAASGNYIAGTALEASSADGEVIAVWVTMPGRVA